MRDALNATGRRIIYYVRCSEGADDARHLDRDFASPAPLCRRTTSTNACKRLCLARRLMTATRRPGPRRSTRTRERGATRRARARTLRGRGRRRSCHGDRRLPICTRCGCVHCKRAYDSTPRSRSKTGFFDNCGHEGSSPSAFPRFSFGLTDSTRGSRSSTTCTSKVRPRLGGGSVMCAIPPPAPRVPRPARAPPAHSRHALVPGAG